MSEHPVRTREPTCEGYGPAPEWVDGPGSILFDAIVSAARFVVITSGVEFLVVDLARRTVLARTRSQSLADHKVRRLIKVTEEGS